MNAPKGAATKDVSGGGVRVYPSKADLAYASYREHWTSKTRRQVEREIESMRRYMDKHGQAYAWHGKDMTPPDTLADGDKMSALREALEIIDARAADARAVKDSLTTEPPAALSEPQS